VTDLLDHQKYKPAEVTELYRQRWEIELRLRDIKTTLEMERFAVKTPEMALKTLWVMLIAYNLVRSQIQKAADLKESLIWRVSFKATLDVITSSHEAFLKFVTRPRKLKEHREMVDALCSDKLVNPRPGRKEPRATKRRPKSYQMLTKPRHVFKEVPHRGNYYKK